MFESLPLTVSPLPYCPCPCWLQVGGRDTHEAAAASAGQGRVVWQRLCELYREVEQEAPAALCVLAGLRVRVCQAGQSQAKHQPVSGQTTATTHDVDKATDGTQGSVNWTLGCALGTTCHESSADPSSTTILTLLLSLQRQLLLLFDMEQGLALRAGCQRGAGAEPHGRQLHHLWRGGAGAGQGSADWARPQLTCCRCSAGLCSWRPGYSQC
ncbi:hypothetical protein HaLaN_20257 [Haematococcus lacustris]|uniref:Uncharacterized protein n=1 Tax=Haematococcus lacustris TaxID=44745 RepID=A0A699ZL44_HAELA|nr:hypothetical protein HaLaN_20257 [Haematococcus lacustris]